MNLLHQPWLELAVVITLLGTFGVSRVRHPERVYVWSVAFIGATFGCTVLAWLAFYVGVPAESLARRSIQPLLFGRQIFVLGRAERPNRADRGALASSGGPVHFADVHAPIFVLVVDGRGDDSTVDFQLQGAVGLDRAPGDLDGAAVRGAA